MAVLQYGLMIFPLTNLVIWLTPTTMKIPIEIIAALLFVGVIAIGVYFAYAPVVRRQQITIPNNKLAGQSLRISIGSDFHFGLVMRKGMLKKFVELSNAENPDIVLLAGDLVDDVPYWYGKYNMAEEMLKLRATYGVYGILGNHEYYGKQLKETIYQMEQSNIRMLIDETIEIPGVCLLTGREDATNKARKKLEDLQQPSELPWLIMDHTPDDIETPNALGANLQVSGHTHRGQMWPNQFITSKTFPLDYGYKKMAHLHAITTSGFGFWGPPVRTNSRSEMWVVDIKFTEL
ncbi:phosphoesterase [Kurthia sibirica]|uniref:Phosphoesterase n=2 Tax=Kurthia sibirica TaxID=202750 RepID=A0A2U3AQC8_9BACL|nr:phosphoesterase [Kurthia sibirica]